MDDSQKLDIIKSRRGTLENEQYAAELDLKLAEKSGNEVLVEEPKQRLAEVNDKLALLDDEEKALGKKG